MSVRILRYVVPALALAIAPVVLAAQQGPAEAVQSSPETQLPPEAQAVIQEMQQIGAQLAPIQEQALEDPALQSAGEALAQRVQAAMTTIDPTTPERMERLKALMLEARAAEAEKNEQRLGEIFSEAEDVQQSLQAAQAQAIQRPEVAADIEGFQARMAEKMVEVDPKAEHLLARFAELNEKLATILGIES